MPELPEVETIRRALDPALVGCRVVAVEARRVKLRLPLDPEAWARAVVEETVDYLAIAVANVSVSFDPELIVLGGGMSGSADLLIEPVLRRLAGSMPNLPRLVASPLGRRAAAMGAIVNVLHNTADFYLLRKLS